MTQETGPKETKELQRKYMEFQMLQQQMQGVDQQVQALDAQAHEMDLVMQTLDDFSRSIAGSDMFVTLTPGLFVKAKLQEIDTVIINVGSGAAVQKSIPEAKQIVAEQGVELRKLQEELAGQLHEFAKTAQKLQEELRELIKS